MSISISLVCGVTDACPLVIVLTRHCVDYARDHQLDPVLFRWTCLQLLLTVSTCLAFTTSQTAEGHDKVTCVLSDSVVYFVCLLQHWHLLQYIMRCCVVGWV